VLMPGCLDTLGMGALLAFMWDTRSHDQIRAFCGRSLAGGRALGAALKSLQYAGYLPTTIHIGMMNTAFALVFMWVVHHAALGFRGPVGSILACPPIVYLGMISYGLYVWHNFAGAFTAQMAEQLGFDSYFPPELGATRFLFVSGFAVIAATVSWFALERPLNEFKRYFPYLRG